MMFIVWAITTLYSPFNAVHGNIGPLLTMITMMRTEMGSESGICANEMDRWR